MIIVGINFHCLVDLMRRSRSSESRGHREAYRIRRPKSLASEGQGRQMIEIITIRRSRLSDNQDHQETDLIRKLTAEKIDIIISPTLTLSGYLTAYYCELNVTSVHDQFASPVLSAASKQNAHLGLLPISFILL